MNQWDKDFVPGVSDGKADITEEEFLEALEYLDELFPRLKGVFILGLNSEDVYGQLHRSGKRDQEELP